MKCLVTGGAGFIGSHLVDRLIADGHEVVVVDNLSTGDLSNVNLKANFHCRDISGVIHNSIFGLFDGVDWVFHLAAVAHTMSAINEPYHCLMSNVIGTENVLRTAKLFKVKKFIYASSNIVYSNPSPYKASKIAAEELVRSYDHNEGMNVVILRYANVYGTRQSERLAWPNVLAAFRKSKRENGEIRITGNGEQSRDFIHVSDVVDATVLTAEKDTLGFTIDICTGKSTTLNEVAGYFNCPIAYTPERKGDANVLFQDPSLAKDILGFEAKVKLEEGITDYL